MMKTKGLAKLGLTVCLLLAFVATASAAKINWQAHNLVGTSYWPGALNVQLAKELEQETNGDFKITVMLTASSGIKGPDILDAVSDNLIQFASMWGSHVAGQEQIMELFDLPLFVPWNFKFRVKLWEALTPDFRKLLLKRYNVYVYSIVQAEPRMIYTKKPVKSLADLKGVKIRAMGPVETSFTRGIGATAVPVNWSETYTALQQGMIDGNWVNDAAQYSAKLHEVTRYIFDIGNAGAGNFYIVSNKAINKLPSGVKAKFLAKERAHTERLRAATGAGASQGRKSLESTGMKAYSVPAKDRAFMLKVAKPIIDKWHPRLDAESRKIYLKAKRMVDAYNARNS